VIYYKVEKGVNMKFLRYSYNNEINYGLLKNENDSTIIKLKGSPFDKYEKLSEEVNIEDVKILTPCDFSKAVCVGLNYRDHAEEFNHPIPESPVLFIKPSTTALAFAENIIKPEICTRLDYEAELAIIIGKKAHNIEEIDASKYILGYTCANDVTARDLQPQNGQWSLAKGFDTFCPFGPYIETEIDPKNLKIQSILNDEVMQESNTSNLIFNPLYLVSYISKVMTLNPGDLILTGTPSGVSHMKDGSKISIKIDGIGELTNTVKYL
jgi:2-keto-4-pentenoate hydratase/2-oxohepta-3-ene-1,7-dioic acid hydratase in catechol pathway